MKQPPNLTPRLQCVAHCVRRGSRVIDVGCDHAHLAAYLVESGRCVCALATDIRTGPCNSAKDTVRRYALESRIEVVQTDGLQGIPFGPFDDVVIAGMGGETMVQILTARPDLPQSGIHLILQPQTDLPLVRTHLYNQGYSFDEHLAVERQKIYHILRAEPSGGHDNPPSLFDLQIGYPRGTHAELSQYYQKLRNTLTVRLEGMRQSAHPAAQTAADIREVTSIVTLLDEKERQHEPHGTTTI